MTKVSENSSFRKIIKQGKLGQYRQFLRQYSSQKFNETLHPSNMDVFEIAIAQRLMGVIASRQNVEAFVRFASNSFAVFAMPKDACILLGLSKIESFFSQVLFYFTILKLSLARFIRALFFVITASKKRFYKNDVERVFVFDITSNALNKRDDASRSHTLENWMRNSFLNSDIHLFHSVVQSKHNQVPLQFFVKNFLPYLSLQHKIVIISKGCFEFATGLLLCLLGKWHTLYAIDDRIYSRCFHHASSENLYGRYCFLFQGNQYRPAWTYIAERKGSKVTLINYSANFVPSLDKKLHDRDYLNTATWNEIVPFHKKFAAFMEEAIGKHIFQPKIIYSNPVYLNDDCSAKLPLFERPTIALFDVQPLDEKFHIGFMDQHDYMENNDFEPGYYNEMFIKNVVSAARQNDFHVALKPKRPDHRVLKNYQKLLLELEAQGILTIVSPSIAPSRLLESTAGGVILPFSTVGYFDIPQETLCFYDVVGCFDGSHQAAFETKVISRFEDLMSWMSNLKTQC